VEVDRSIVVATTTTDMTYVLDDVDKQLLNRLQENARYTATELADAVGVSDNTVHNRMDRLEDAGVIKGYGATVDKKAAGFDLFFHFSCTARISERTEKAQRALEIPAVVDVTELMTGQENLYITAVGATDDDISEVARRIESFDIEINDENLVRERHSKTLDYVALADNSGEE